MKFKEKTLEKFLKKLDDKDTFFNEQKTELALNFCKKINKNIKKIKT